MIIIIFLALMLGGFFFPPLWLALVGYTIYIFVSSKKRRDTAIEDRVRRMIKGKLNFATFHDVYFEAASAYAKSHGASAKPVDPNFALTHIEIDGDEYEIGFMKNSGGGTVITLSEY